MQVYPEKVGAQVFFKKKVGFKSRTGPNPSKRFLEIYCKSGLKSLPLGDFCGLKQTQPQTQVLNRFLISGRKT